jgi:hypothetical protein
MSKFPEVVLLGIRVHVERCGSEFRAHRHAPDTEEES